MKNFNVLLTCCSIHVKEVIDCLKNNEDGVDIKVYVANSVAANLPPAELSDGNFVVPPVSVEKPLNFDPFGHARFAHLFVLYD